MPAYIALQAYLDIWCPSARCSYLLSSVKVSAIVYGMFMQLKIFHCGAINAGFDA